MRQAHVTDSGGITTRECEPSTYWNLVASYRADNARLIISMHTEGSEPGSSKYAGTRSEHVLTERLCFFIYITLPSLPGPIHTCICDGYKLHSLCRQKTKLAPRFALS